MNRSTEYEHCDEYVYKIKMSENKWTEVERALIIVIQMKSIS